MKSLRSRHAKDSDSIRSEDVPLVDRIEELNILKGAADKLAQGEGSLVLIHGEAGIGKTRLIRELGKYAQSHGVQILSGGRPSLSRTDGIPPYDLWREVIEHYLDVSTPDQLRKIIGFCPAEVAKLVPEINQKLGAIPQSFPIDPEQEQNRLFEAVSQFTRNVSKETPLLVVLDDLQWTDPSSLRLLLYVAHDVRKTSLLLLGAYRSTEIDAQHPLTSVLAELRREHMPQSVSLKRMPLKDTIEIIKRILKQDDVSQEFCEKVYEKAKGNPFFTEEVIRSLKEEGLIFREDNQWKIKKIGEIELPKTVKSLMKARIDRLDEECRNAMTMASFIGNDFGFEELQATTQIEKRKLLGIMEKMLKTGLIRKRVIRGKDEYGFSDAIVRDVFHEEVAQSRHRKFHSEIGSALEGIYAEQIDEHLSKLAYHFMESGEKDKALWYSLRAGEKSQEMYAYDEAFSYFSHAVVLLEEKEDSVEEEARVIERLGDIKTWIGQWDIGLDYWNKALKLRIEIEDTRSAASLHSKMAHALWNVAGDKAKASEHHQMALHILEREPESSELASLYEDIGHRLWRSGESEALSWLDKGLALAERLGDSRVLAECYDDLGALTVGDLEKTKQYWEQGLIIAVINNNSEAALRLYHNLCELHWLIGEPQKALETNQKGLDLAKKVGDLNLFLWLSGNLASSYSSMGDLHKALDLLESNLAMAKKTRNLSYIPTALLRIGECYLRLGEWKNSLQYLTEAVDTARKAQEFGSLAMGSLRLGELMMETGDFQKAKEYFAESVRICEKASEKTGLLFEVYPPLSKLYIKEGALEKARKLIAEILEFSAETKNNVLLAIAEMLEAMFLRAQKNLEQSLQHFQKSFQTFKDLNAQKWYTFHFNGLLYEYGSTLLDRSEGDDVERAHALLKQALEISQKRGAKKDAEKIEAELTRKETRTAGQTLSSPTSIDQISAGTTSPIDRSIGLLKVPERDQIPTHCPAATRETLLVNRTEEISILKETADRAIQGTGSLVLVHGEAGIGKTRLLREFGTYAQSRGMRVLYGRSLALFRMDGVPPYVLWKEVIKDYLETCTPQQLFRVIGYYPAEVAKLVPEISQKLRTIPHSYSINPEQEQIRLFEAVSQFITNISRETPLLVILDDLQWSDPSSLLLLHYMARGIQRARLILVGAYRSDNIDSNHSLTTILAELNRERLSQSISLKRMSADDVSTIVRQLLEQDDVPTEFCRMVYNKTRGNPFFTEEVIKSLKEDEVIYREENKWKITQVSRIEFPESVKSVVKARIGRLEDECLNVLTLASFIGNDFTLEEIGALSSIEEGKLLGLMESMFQTGLIKERVIRGREVCSFADVLVRDVVYEEISPLKAKEIHRAVGTSLEKIYGSSIDEHYGELASHFLESGDKDKAFNYFTKAAERAEKIHAYSEAASYLQSAYRLEDENKPFEQANMLEKLGDVKQLAGEYDICEVFWNHALTLWKKLSADESIARIHRKIANSLWKVRADTEKARIHHEEALRILENLPESIELARLLADMARMYSRTEDETKALSLANRTAELAEKLDAPEITASSYGTLGMVFAEIKGDRKKALEYYEKSLQIALDNDYVESALRAYNNMCAALEDEHEHEKALQVGETGLELARKVGATFWVSWTGSGLADTYISMGDIDKGIALAEETAALSRKAANISGLGFSLSVLGRAYQILGEREKSEELLTEALDIAEKAKDIQQTCLTYRNLGILYYQRGEYARAREQFERSFDLYEKAGWTYRQASNALWLSRIDTERGDLAQAEKFLNLAKKTVAESKDRQLIAALYAVNGMLLRTQKSWKESIDSFEKSLRECKSFNAERWAAPFFAEFVLSEYARVYLERDQKGDKEEAHNLLSQALELFRKMGAKKDIERIEAKLHYIETGRKAQILKPSDLVSTGYTAVDGLLYGGIPSHYAVLLTSPSCDERDLLVKSFLETGVEKGEVVFFLTIKPGSAKLLAEEFQSNLHLLVANPRADAIAKDLPNVSKLKGIENLTEISIALTSAIHTLDSSQESPRRICIDLVSDILLQHHAIQTRRWLTALISELTSENFTTLAVVDPQMHPSEELHAILGLFDGEINIYEKGAERFLRIRRMSNQKYMASEVALTRST